MEHPTRIDNRLLGRYVDDGSQAAFARMVELYVKLVYTTCYRELHQRELAEEATQAVFLVLAKKAGTIRSEANLATWLYTAARFEARVIRRQEQRRMAGELQAVMEAQRRYDRSDDEAWRTIEPALNDSIDVLPTKDREAILLRFFEEKSLREVGLAMGTSEDAARMRVSRALQKLRQALLSRRAAVVSVAALAALLTTRATYAVPANVTAAVIQSIASSSLSAPVSGGWVPASRLAGRGGSALHPLIAKGILIMSTHKIVTGSAAAVALLMAVTLVGALRANPSASPAAKSWASGSSLRPLMVWQAAPLANHAVQQQLEAVIGKQADLVTHHQNHEFKQNIITGCTTSGNTATVHFYTNITNASHSTPYQSCWQIDTYVNTGGQWHCTGSRPDYGHKP